MNDQCAKIKTIRFYPVDEQAWAATVSDLVQKFGFPSDEAAVEAHVDTSPDCAHWFAGSTLHIFQASPYANSVEDDA